MAKIIKDIEDLEAKRPKKIIRYIVTYIEAVNNTKQVRVVTADTPKQTLDIMFKKHNAKEIIKIRLLFNPIIKSINESNGYSTSESQSEDIKFN